LRNRMLVTRWRARSFAALRMTQKKQAALVSFWAKASVAKNPEGRSGVRR